MHCLQTIPTASFMHSSQPEPGQGKQEPDWE